jgi:hypothetical protein
MGGETPWKRFSASCAVSFPEFMACAAMVLLLQVVYAGMQHLLCVCSDTARRARWKECFASLCCDLPMRVV